MPLKTFLNLPESKKNRIIKAALNEFATNNYNSASLNKIIESANISKGSMYQYFENKKDLYLYLINLASITKLGTITNAIVKLKNKNFYELLKLIHLEGLKFDLSHPNYSRLLINAANERNNEELKNISNDILRQSDKYFEYFIIEAQKKGQIRNDIDYKFISFIISRISLSISDFISIKYNFAYEDIMKKKQEKLPVPRKKIEDTLNDMIEILRTGLNSKQD